MYKAEFNINNKKEKLSKEKLLTIGIVTKNQSEKLERCLKSLVPIREAIDCEIIVTDTGSTDNTLEIAGIYADKIIRFDWNNDFAAARNTGVEAAKGLWFMWIDSDEWIENPEGIIDFFANGKYKKYASASINFRDYFDKERSIYRDNTLFRMTLLFSKCRFEGEIHETVPISKAIINLNSRICHDGYVFNNDEERSAKYKRNIDALMNVYQKDKANLKTIYYLAEQYKMVFDYDASINILDDGIETIENKIKLSEEDKLFKLYFKINKAINLLDKTKYMEAINILENEVDNNDKISYLFLDLYYVLWIASYNLGLDITYLYASKYLEYMKKIKTNKFNTEYVNVINNIFTQETEYIRALEFILNEPSENTNNILQYIKTLDYILLEDNMEVLESYIEIVTKFITDTNSTDHEERIKLFKTFFEKNIKENKNIYFIKLLYSYMIKDEKAMQIAIDKFTELNSGKLEYRYAYIIYVLLNQNKDLGNYLSKLNLDIFETRFYIENIYKYDEQFIYKLLEYVDKNKPLTLEESYFMLIAIEYLININFEDDIIQTVFEVNLELLSKIIPEIYKKQAIDSINKTIFPRIIRYGYYILESEKYKIQKNELQYIKNLRRALEEYPLMEKPIKHIISNIEKRQKEEYNRKLEFEQLAVGIKRKIYELITMGNEEEALSVICQLQSILPQDMELKELKSRLTSKKNL